jgi:hypothetical protein
MSYGDDITMFVFLVLPVVVACVNISTLSIEDVACAMVSETSESATKHMTIANDITETFRDMWGVGGQTVGINS